MVKLEDVKTESSAPPTDSTFAAIKKAAVAAIASSNKSVAAARDSNNSTYKAPTKKNSGVAVSSSAETVTAAEEGASTRNFASLEGVSKYKESKGSSNSPGKKEKKGCSMNGSSNESTPESHSSRGGANKSSGEGKSGSSRGPAGMGSNEAGAQSPIEPRSASRSPSPARSERRLSNKRAAEENGGGSGGSSRRRRIDESGHAADGEDRTSRSNRREGSRRGGGREVRTERMNITDADASFILGTGGRTKRKLARVARAELSVTQNGPGDTVLEIRGTPEAIDRAKTYVGFVIQQRVGPVTLSEEVKQRDDLVTLEIPHDCVGYVTGAKGQGLRAVEEEFVTLMFFTDVNKNRAPEEAPKTEKLVIFSPSERARQGAVLKVMSAIEQKIPGQFTTDVKEVMSEKEAFDIDIVKVAEDDYSYALGRGGATRRKLAKASGAVLEYIGKYAYLAGDKGQRERARQYLQWLCEQRVGIMNLAGVDRRTDVELLDVPMDCVAYVTGQRGQALRHIEEQTGTFMFLDGTREGTSEKLYIFGESESGRKRARQLAEERIDEKITGVSRRARERARERDRSPRGRYRDYRGSSLQPPDRSGSRRWMSPRRGRSPSPYDRPPPTDEYRYGPPMDRRPLSPPPYGNYGRDASRRRDSSRIEYDRRPTKRFRGDSMPEDMLPPPRSAGRFMDDPYGPPPPGHPEDYPARSGDYYYDRPPPGDYYYDRPSRGGHMPPPGPSRYHHY